MAQRCMQLADAISPIGPSALSIECAPVTDLSIPLVNLFSPQIDLLLGHGVASDLSNGWWSIEAL